MTTSSSIVIWESLTVAVEHAGAGLFVRFFSDAVNSRLEAVIIPRWLSSEVVVCATCLMDYYFHVYWRLRKLGSWQRSLSTQALPMFAVCRIPLHWNRTSHSKRSRVNDVAVSNVIYSPRTSLNPGTPATIQVNRSFASGTRYEFAIMTITGKTYNYLATVP